MAGIAGIISKKERPNIGSYFPAFDQMIKGLGISDIQLKTSTHTSHIIFGNVDTLSSERNENYQYNEKLDLHCIVDGLVFIGDEEKSILGDHYHVRKNCPDYELLPYLFDRYKFEIVNHITGWYNIVFVDAGNGGTFLFNDFLGYLPLYYYESDTMFMFASKIECLLASGLIPSLEFDYTSIAEHLFFNYTLSDYTFIKGIKVLSNATSLYFQGDTKSERKYWGIEDLFDFKPANEKESYQLINEGLNCAIGKILNHSQKNVNQTLTGGWDSRIVLSLLLPEHKNRLKLYSFAADKNDDITIPEYIAGKEQIHYEPYVLDEDYLVNQFVPSSVDTILLSNGTRNYKRSHYLYTIKQIAAGSDLLINGNFGDEVFKVAQVSGGSVISKNAVDFIGSGFNVDKTLKSFNESSFLENIVVNHDRLKEDFAFRMNLLKGKTDTFDTLSKKFQYFRFEINLRKYFGAEVNSYNDYVYSFSPFIDFDFIHSLARTKFFGIHYPFNTNDLKLKMQTTLLYTRLTQLNYKPLIYYNSTRGYSMHDATTTLGKLKIYLKKFHKTKKIAVDGFNTKPTDDIFLNHLKQSSALKHNSGLSQVTDFDNKYACDINSLVFWKNSMEQKYF